MEHKNSSPAPLLSVNGLNFEAEVLKSNLPVLIDVTSAWCAPCKLAEPVVQKLSEELSGTVKVVKVDGDESPELLKQLSIRGFPSFLYFEKSEEVRRTVGFRGERELRKLIAQ